jgi:hypothetical protein
MCLVHVWTSGLGPEANDIGAVAPKYEGRWRAAIGLPRLFGRAGCGQQRLSHTTILDDLPPCRLSSRPPKKRAPPVPSPEARQGPCEEHAGDALCREAQGIRLRTSSHIQLCRFQVKRVQRMQGYSIVSLTLPQNWQGGKLLIVTKKTKLHRPSSMAASDTQRQSCRHHLRLAHISRY